MTSNLSTLLDNVNRADSAKALVDAVEALAATQETAAIPSLVEVLSFNNPRAAIAAVDGLINMGISAVPYLLEHIDGYNYGARAWATRALAGIGDPRALDLLLEAASKDFSLSVRLAAAKGLGFLHWERVDREQRPSLQLQVLETLLQVCHDSEWVVRYGAVVGLEGLSSSLDSSLSQHLTSIHNRLEVMAKTDEEIAIRARSQLALKSNNG
jgi:phycocyanobilin lyase beta subunit